MENDSFTTTATKHGLTPEQLDKASAELYGILSVYDPKEIRAIAELIENGTPSRMYERGKGAGR